MRAGVEHHGPASKCDKRDMQSLSNSGQIVMDYRPVLFCTSRARIHMYAVGVRAITNAS